MVVDTHTSDFMRQLDRIRSQGAVLIACLMLSVDAINPIKTICGVLGIPIEFAAYGSLLLLLYLLGSYFSELTYFGVRVFFTSILSIFFAKNDVIGHSNIPRDGPIIFTGNHANQFVDALQVMTNCGHKVGFLIAEKSFNQKVVGFFARILGCIPVARPQDAAIKMPQNQTIRAEGCRVFGKNTQFKTQLSKKDKIRFRGQSEQLVVKEVISDTEVVVEQDLGDEFREASSQWDMLRYIDQSTVFDGVYEALRMGQCLGIFPEGGSHDRTDLLPLKVGVAVIAFGMLEKHNILVPIVPIGLNYYRGHRFRGRAVVEFGPPIRISPELYDMYKQNKRDAYTALLIQIEGSMRSCIVTAPDYNALKLVYTARRLYQPSHKIPSPELKQDMNRRFAEGYKILLRRYNAGGSNRVPGSPSKGYNSDDEQPNFLENNLPEDAKTLKKHLEDYQRKLNILGLRDYQVPILATPYPLKATYIILHLFFVSLLAAIPSLILNAPVGLVARIMAETERKKSLAGSVVKITARDVMMSKKIIISIVMVPSLWLIYAILIFLCTSWRTDTKVLVVLCMPVFSYAGIMATEAGMVDAKDLKPILMRLRPAVKREMLALPALRSKVQAELREFVTRVGPSLGDIYNKTEPLTWNVATSYNHHSSSTANLANMAKNAVAAMEITEEINQKED